MVEDSISKRKTPSVLTFCQDKRYFEYQSLSKFNKKRCTSFFYLNRYLHPEGSKEQKYYSSNVFKFKDHSLPSKDKYGLMFNINKKSLPEGLKLPREGESEQNFPIRFEELYSMLIRNMKKNAERTAEMQFKNGVFTIWDNSMTIELRKKLASSIIMSDIYPSAFVHENTAAAIYYAVNA